MSHFQKVDQKLTKFKYKICEVAAGTEYLKLQGCSKTRWFTLSGVAGDWVFNPLPHFIILVTPLLALMPSIERILQLYVPLKDYFLSIKMCSTVSINFFEVMGYPVF